MGDQVSGVPHFFGAEPAMVLEGQHAGLRPPREETWRELMLALRRTSGGWRGSRYKAPADIASSWIRWLRYRSSRAASVRTAGPVAA